MTKIPRRDDTRAEKYSRLQEVAGWLADGKDVQYLDRNGTWMQYTQVAMPLLDPDVRYRLAPLKPREYVIEYGHDDLFRLVCRIEGMGPRAGDRIRVREVIEE